MPRMYWRVPLPEDGESINNSQPGVMELPHLTSPTSHNQPSEAGAGFTRCQREEGMSLTKDHSFFPLPEPRCVFLTKLQLKGNLAFCWRGAGLDWEEQVTPVRCYWGESDAVARVWDRAAGPYFYTSYRYQRFSNYKIF